MSILKQSHLGSTVFYAVGPTERMVAIITQVHADDRANLALIKNGVHQAHHPDYAYEVPYGAVCPMGEMTPDTWHSRANA